MGIPDVNHYSGVRTDGNSIQYKIGKKYSGNPRKEPGRDVRKNMPRIVET